MARYTVLDKSPKTLAELQKALEEIATAAKLDGSTPDMVYIEGPYEQEFIGLSLLEEKLSDGSKVYTLQLG
jgi:hypothetical protein